MSNAFKKRMILDSFFAFNCSGTMKVSTWVYDKGEWYYVSSSGAMIANDWVKDNGK
ncbi:cell wall binding repeat family protein [Streptococcus pneumoniae 2090008]|nr:cell wall binding repeat family protein [Streptococcus pneumoniae GA07228]EHE70812.1 cell wall binding repeat family protein [Streptococcus pneumoniae GA19690]EJG33565.1 cell wall binding repeat family protein [Streptococcus pneumoniae 2090008]EJG53277.1 cell wall binding repeat family protein [Streptococcus pneumoniae 2061376]